MVENIKTEGTDPTEYAELRAVIVEKYPSLSPQHKEISEFSLSNPEIIAVETGAQLADRLNVQPSSLVRWAQALGFPGLRELIRRVRSQLVYQAGDSRDQTAANSNLGSIMNSKLPNNAILLLANFLKIKKMGITVIVDSMILVVLCTCIN